MWGVRSNDRGQRELRLAIGRIVSDFSAGLHDSVTKGRGIESVGYRQYESSDTARDIAWRATARLAEDDDILSHNFAPERQMRIVVVADEYRSMQLPPQKARYADALVRLFAFSAFANEDLCTLVGISRDGMISSDWLHNENDLAEFLDAADDPRRRSSYRSDAKNVSELLGEIGLKNMLIVFLTDLVSLERVPLEALREADPDLNVQCIAVVLDEWSGFEPSPHSVVFEHAESGRTAALDMRTGGGVDREVSAFRGRLRTLHDQGKALGLTVLTVPLAEENPLRSFYKQWERHFEED